MKNPKTENGRQGPQSPPDRTGAGQNRKRGTTASLLRLAQGGGVCPQPPPGLANRQTAIQAPGKTTTKQGPTCSKTGPRFAPSAVIRHVLQTLQFVDIYVGGTLATNLGVGAPRIVRRGNVLSHAWIAGAPLPVNAHKPLADNAIIERELAQAGRDIRLFVDAGHLQAEQLRDCWRTLVMYHAAGLFSAAIWFGSDATQLMQLYSTRHAYPLQFPTMSVNTKLNAKRGYLTLLASEPAAPFVARFRSNTEIGAHFREGGRQ